MNRATAAGGPAWGQGTLLALAGLTILGLALRLPSLDDALFADELSTHFIVHGFGVDGLIDLVRSNSEVTPPLFFLAADAGSWLGGGFWTLKLPSIVSGLASIPAMYLLGLRTVGRRAALVAAALTTVAPFQVFYATEARGYAMAMFLCILATLLLLRASDDREGGHVWGWWAGFAVAAAASVYTHYSSVFLMLALAAWAFFARPHSRLPLLAAGAVAALLFAPWLSEYSRDSDAPNGAKLVAQLNPVTLDTIKTDLGHWAFGHPFTPVADVPTNPALALIGAGLLLGSLGLLMRRGLRGLWPPTGGIVLVAVLALAAPAGALAYAAFSEASVFGARYLIVSWPGLALAMAALVCGGRGVVRAAAIAALLAGYSLGAVQMLSGDEQRPDFIAAAHFIEERGEPGSPVVDSPQPTPGPTTAMETALAGMGEAVPSDREVLTLNFPAYEDRIEARRTDGPDGIDGVDVVKPLPVPPPAEVAREAARQAGDGPIFLVTGDAPLEYLENLEGAPVSEFLRALPPRFREAEHRRFEGLWVTPIRVTVLEPEPPA